MDDDWEQVFLQAAGSSGGGGVTDTPESRITTTTTTTMMTNQSNHQQPMKKKRRRSSQQLPLLPLKNENHSCYYTLGESFPITLTTTTTVCTDIHIHHNNPTTTTAVTIPQIIKVHDCNQYIPFMSSKYQKTLLSLSSELLPIERHQHHHHFEMYTTSSSSSCQQCGQSSGYHQMQMTDSTIPLLHSSSSLLLNEAAVVQLYITIRNLRCYCRIQLLFHSFNYKSTTTTSTSSTSKVPVLTTPLLLQKYQKEFISIVHDRNQSLNQRKNKHHPSSHSDLLCDITIRNVQCLIQHLQQPMNSNNHNEMSYAIHLIQCIIKCDEIYSRLYYNDCVSSTTTTTTNPSSNHQQIIPHPLTYYSEWECSSSDSNPKNTHSKTNHSGTNGTTTMMENPLYRIYQYRMAETWSIFNAFIIIKDDASQPVSSLQLLRQCKYEWDLSCRDDLCHMYCYATISNATLQEMIQYLIEQLQCDHIIEMGAGTGYLAYWLQKLGQSYITNHTNHGDRHTSSFHVSAYDIANSAVAPSTNEYHADMAGYYYNIDRGDGCNRKSSNIIYDRHYNNNITNVALLLCYPPPDNTMGYDAIRNYHTYRPLKNQKTIKIVIHIGEQNKGLTGTRAMEKYLLQYFQCIQRYPCHLYGSVDASDITIWIDRNADTRIGTSKLDAKFKETPSNSLLLPCSYCQNNEGIRRCKRLRSLVFCSNSCYQQHMVDVRKIQPNNGTDKLQQQQPDEQQMRLLLWKIIQVEQLDFQNDDHFEPLYTQYNVYK